VISFRSTQLEFTIVEYQPFHMFSSNQTSGLILQLFGTLTGSLSVLAILRVVGVALYVTGIVCWLSRNNEQSRFTQILVIALMVYNITIPIAFIYAALVLHIIGPGLWPGTLIHLVMLIWSIMCVKDKKGQNTKQLD
jgi:uncharacterized membrane protein